MSTKNIQIEDSWKEVLTPEFEQDYFVQLKEFLVREKMEHIVYPPGDLMFSAYNNTPFNNVKVVIIGQDPYHGPNQAHGLCFSVPEGVKIPPSLRNIYKELQSDVGIAAPTKGDLTSWAKQGVLLLNATLSVRAHQAGSHQKKGWEIFTNQTIKKVSEELEHVVFLLWGAFAQKKAELIDQEKHLILKSVHPSPLSAHRGFLGCKHFSQTNNYLIKMGEKPIDWNP
ncbi:MAG: uracil-DNA glycosylase [Bacteroidales bacterium]|nr:uracil-DNA glycosylase [Bacteroidales bacterium]